MTSRPHHNNHHRRLVQTVGTPVIADGFPCSKTLSGSTRQAVTAPLVVVTRATERRCSTGGGHPPPAPRSVCPKQHNAPPGPTTASAMEVEVRECARRPNVNRSRRHLCGAAGLVGRSSLPVLEVFLRWLRVVMVQEAAHDNATVSYRPFANTARRAGGEGGGGARGEGRAAWSSRSLRSVHAA